MPSFLRVEVIMATLQDLAAQYRYSAALLAQRIAALKRRPDCDRRRVQVLSGMLQETRRVQHTLEGYYRAGRDEGITMAGRILTGEADRAGRR